MRNYLSLVTFGHTVFALPFAVLGFALAVAHPEHAFSWWTFAGVIGCMVFARNAAMAFNRLVDADFDAANERTRTRDIPAGRVSRGRAGAFVAVNAGLFVVCAAALNPLCGWLSPVALAVVLGYSYSKRFTWWCHAILGLGLALAPVGAYLAVAAEFHILPVVYGLVVLTWVAGFDIVYALQDESFDRQRGLESVPAHFGAVRSLWIARGLHLACTCLLLVATFEVSRYYPVAGLFLLVGFGAFTAALFYQHRIVSAGDLSRIDRAFFTTNGVASVIYAVVVVVGLAFA